MEHTTRDLFVDRIMEAVDHGFNHSEIQALEELVEAEFTLCRSEEPAPAAEQPGGG